MGTEPARGTRPVGFAHMRSGYWTGMLCMAGGLTVCWFERHVATARRIPLARVGPTWTTTKQQTRKPPKRKYTVPQHSTVPHAGQGRHPRQLVIDDPHRHSATIADDAGALNRHSCVEARGKPASGDHAVRKAKAREGPQTENEGGRRQLGYDRALLKTGKRRRSGDGEPHVHQPRMPLLQRAASSERGASYHVLG
jgi:hypothetical protein